MKDRETGRDETKRAQVLFGSVQQIFDLSELIKLEIEREIS